MNQTIQNLIENYPPALLKQAAQDISARYRRVTTHDDFAIQNEIEATAYLATRFPATAQAVARVLDEIDDPAIQSCLDVGAGVGTGCLMALARFPKLARLSLIEPNRHLNMLAKKILALPDQTTIWHEVKAQKMQELNLPAHDLVIASYSLNECPASDLERLLALMWSVTQKYLVIIDAGTPRGFEIIVKARAFAEKENASLLAPCPHLLACPLHALGRFCHFSVRLPRDKLHKYLKDGARGFEDEKFSYIILSKAPKESQAAQRLIGAPRLGKVISAEVCDRDGLAKKLLVAKSHPAYKSLRHKKWGDTIDC